VRDSTSEAEAIAALSRPSAMVERERMLTGCMSCFYVGVFMYEIESGRGLEELVKKC